MKRAFIFVLSVTCFFVFGCKDVNDTNNIDDEDIYEKLELNQVYENGWPSFTINYPSGWTKNISEPFSYLLYEAPAGTPGLSVGASLTTDVPLRNAGRVIQREITSIGSKIKKIYDKSITLNDGTTARELEYSWIKNGEKFNSYYLVIEKEGVWIKIIITDKDRKISKSLKEIAYSIQVDPNDSKPAKLPEDIKEFVNKLEKAVEKNDFKTFLECYSEDYFFNGADKSAFAERAKTWFYNVTDFKIIITKTENINDKVKVAGYMLLKNRIKCGYTEAYGKEEGKWKCFGSVKSEQI